MNQLVIKLTGQVNSSNFNEWKKDLIVLIQSTNKELLSDRDFFIAERQIKSFKVAEQSLKQAKQSAIHQAEEIHKLFAAIDEVTEAARQARLSLEHQIKKRKVEIKNHSIDRGIEEIEKFKDKQSVEFLLIDKSNFINRHRFESAISRKSGIKGVQSEIDKLCSQIKEEISDKAEIISNNKNKLDALANDYKFLFQDIKYLVDLSEDELEFEIDKRISNYNEAIAKKEQSKLSTESRLNISKDDTQFGKVITEEIGNEPKKKFQIIIDLLSTRDKATILVGAIMTNYGKDQSINSIQLVENHNEFKIDLTKDRYYLKHYTDVNSGKKNVDALKNDDQIVKSQSIKLNSFQKEIFSNLKQWRTGEARKQGLPPFTIAQNYALMELAVSSAKEKKDLLKIKGFGEKRVEKYGDEILEIINNGNVTNSNQKNQEA